MPQQWDETPERDMTEKDYGDAEITALKKPKYDLRAVPLDEMVREIARRSYYPGSGIRYHAVDHKDEMWEVRRHDRVVSSGKGAAEIMVVIP